MKKYLMIGAAALALGGTFVGCSKDKDLYDPQKDAQEFLQNYRDAFIKAFGQVYNDQTWGFSDASKARTTRLVDVNGNEWLDHPELGATESQDVKDYVNMTLAEMQTAGHAYYTTSPVNLTDYWVTQVYKGTDSYSNSDYANGIVGSDHMDNLHIKEVSTATITNGALSETGWYHVNNFNAGNNTDWWGNTLIHESGTFDFAYHGSEDARYHNRWIIVRGEDIDASKYAGYFYVCFDFEAYTPVVTSCRLDFVYTHIADGGHEQSENVSLLIQLIGHYDDAAAVKAALGNTYNYNGVDVDITNATIRDIQYVNGNQEVQPNNVYTDWIIRLVDATPDTPQPTVKKIRVMAEDVSAQEKGDFDFNDVVFDVEATFPVGETEVNQVKVTVYAAGGTLPLKIGSTEGVGGFEVHGAMGQTTNTMINTAAEPYADGVHWFAIDGVPAYTTTLTLDNNVTINVETFNADVNEYVRVEVEKTEGSWLLLTAKRGQPCCKIGVPVTTPWAMEKTHMETAFPGFTDWVNNGTEGWQSRAVSGKVLYD